MTSDVVEVPLLVVDELTPEQQRAARRQIARRAVDLQDEWKILNALGLQ